MVIPLMSQIALVMMIDAAANRLDDAEVRQQSRPSSEERNRNYQLGNMGETDYTLHKSKPMHNLPFADLHVRLLKGGKQRLTSANRRQKTMNIR